MTPYTGSSLQLTSEEKKEFDKLLGYTGSDSQADFKSFPTITLFNVKQASNFSDSDNIKVSDEGKLYIKSGGDNTSQDLRREISATLIKERSGSEYWCDNKLVYSAAHSIGDATKTELLEKYPPVKEGERPDNIMLVLLKLDEVMNMANGESYEYVLLKVRRANYGAYMQEVRIKQKDLYYASELKNSFSSIAKLPVCFWHIAITSELVKKDGKEWRQLNFLLTMHPSHTAAGMIDEVIKAKDFDLTNMQENKMKKEGEVVEREEDEEVIDLPF